MELPVERGWRDDDCWVRIAGDPPDGRWRLAGNAHTHRGHLHVETLDGTWSTTVDLHDIVEASPLARAWLSGFLQGQEPDQWAYLGYDGDLLEDADENDDARWFAWNDWFRQRGYAPPLAVLPPPADVLATVVDPPAWVLVGGLYRVYRDGAWVVADPQPQVARPDTWAWPGSVCEQRRHHSLTQVCDGLRVCDDCHEASV